MIDEALLYVVALLIFFACTQSVVQGIEDQEKEDDKKDDDK